MIGMILLRSAVFLAGLTLVALTLLSAVRTFVLPRSALDPITHATYVSLRKVFNLRLRLARTFRDRDRVMALYAPIGMLVLLAVWLSLVLAGYTLMYRALGIASWREAFVISGSSLFTLGFDAGNTLPEIIAMFSEAMIGLILVALLIGYLPTMYGAFSQRERAVTLLEVRAGSPPSAIELLLRFNRLGRLGQLGQVWVDWEGWFAEIEESHTSLAALVFFRSPQPDHSWVTASGAVLDAAALVNSAVDLPHDPQADLCLRAGYLALRRIAEFFQIRHNPDPRHPDDPISVTREEFDAALDRLAAGGVPLRSDRDEAWRHFAGWRVNYDTVLIELCRMVMAPTAPWSADRVGDRRTSITPP
jgi:hypothetical protein